MPDDTCSLTPEFMKRLRRMLLNEHGQPAVDHKKQNPYRPTPDLREDQRRWLPIREHLEKSARVMSSAFGAVIALASVLLALGILEWAYGANRFFNSSTCLMASGFSFAARKLYKTAKSTTAFIEGMDSLYRLPLKCDECNRTCFKPAVPRCGKCEVCPSCEAPIYPGSRVEQCMDCQLSQADGGLVMVDDV